MTQELVVEVSEEVALYWQALATQAQVPLEEWIAWCCTFACALGVPINEAILGQAPVERELAGVAWEVRSARGFEGHCSGEVLDNTVPVVDVRTGIRARAALATRKATLGGGLGRDPEAGSTVSGNQLTPVPAR